MNQATITQIEQSDQDCQILNHDANTINAKNGPIELKFICVQEMRFLKTFRFLLAWKLKSP